MSSIENPSLKGEGTAPIGGDTPVTPQPISGGRFKNLEEFKTKFPEEFQKFVESYAIECVMKLKREADKFRQRQKERERESRG